MVSSSSSKLTRPFSFRSNRYDGLRLHIPNCDALWRMDCSYRSLHPLPYHQVSSLFRSRLSTPFASEREG